MRRFLFIAAALFALGPALADEAHPRLELHYSPAENLEQIDVETIDGAGETLDVAAYVLSDVAVIEAMTLAAERGVRIRLFREPSQERSRGPTVDTALARLLAEPTVFAKSNKRGAWMHLKAYARDGRLLRFGAANLSASGEKRQDNDLLLTDDPALVKGFETEFETLWSRP
ncbi:MAG: phospholipase D-like domain-containing protein [Roseiarcus sp.]|jgi:phosphatidylserine/phosphatidylglycerophosphate/cardiolipin synthase-like enzyme